jgi:hypothetical protein
MGCPIGTDQRLATALSSAQHVKVVPSVGP